MTEQKPIVYILRGDDREAVETHIHHFYQALGQPDMADMNMSRLEGKSANLNDLRSAALALPFLTERRLVVVEDALSLLDKFSKGANLEQMTDLFNSLPQTTALVLVISDTQKNRNRGGTWESYWVTLGKKHWLIQWTENAGSKAMIIDCALPSGNEMVNWIRRKATEKGGSFTPSAAVLLGEYLGSNTQRAAVEIEKLLTYVNLERPVDDDDVRRLSIQEQQSDIFEMVDAIGSRDGDTALKLLHLLLEDQPFLMVFSMIIRQFRLILQAREIIDAGGDEQAVAKQLGQHQFVARKVAAQARRFELPTLESIYHQLLQIDLDAKSGGMAGDAALDVLIARLANGLL
jgi:DNA polymerase-3 subunit delta